MTKKKEVTLKLLSWISREEGKHNTINWKNNTMTEGNKWKDKNNWKELRMRREFFNCKLP